MTQPDPKPSRAIGFYMPSEAHKDDRFTLADAITRGIDFNEGYESGLLEEAAHRVRLLTKMVATLATALDKHNLLDDEAFSELTLYPYSTKDDSLGGN